MMGGRRASANAPPTKKVEEKGNGNLKWHNKLITYRNKTGSRKACRPGKLSCTSRDNYFREPLHPFCDSDSNAVTTILARFKSLFPK